MACGVAMYMWLDLRAARTALTIIERSQVVVETQLALAADVQRRLLPPVPASVDHVQWASELKAAGEIGGDFYDFISTEYDSTLGMVGDVSGKGIPAPLGQASGPSLFRTFWRGTPQPPDAV